MATIRIDTLLRDNSFIESEKGRKKGYLRVSAEAQAEVAHRLRDIWVPELARIAAERADRRGSKTVMLQDVLDAFHILKGGVA